MMKITTAFARRRLQQGQLRSFSVKEVSWCAPPGSPNKKSRNRSSNEQHPREETTPVSQPTAPFGIVAAMSKNRVIGIDGKLPWNIPHDRQHFKNLTRDAILICGRKTYQDTPDELNIAHVRHCIVLSKTADENMGSDRVKVARSFANALHMAKELSIDDDDDKLDCWIGGGEAVYAQALKHESAQEVQLTLIDMNVPINEVNPSQVARFPAKYRWDQRFVETSRREVPVQSDEPSYSFVGYKRKR